MLALAGWWIVSVLTPLYDSLTSTRLRIDACDNERRWATGCSVQEMPVDFTYDRPATNDYNARASTAEWRVYRVTLLPVAACV